MLGLIHRAIMEMVLEIFGEEPWNNVLKQGNFHEDDMFLMYHQYHDRDTYNLVQCVSDILNIPVNTLLYKLGEFFFLYHMNHDYNVLLRRIGVDFVAFVQNLDSVHYLVTKYRLHNHVKYPSFRCIEKDQGTIMVLYSSVRQGFAPMAIGILETVAREIFYQKATIQEVSINKIEIGPKQRIYQTVLKVELESLQSLKEPAPKLEWALGDNDASQETRSSLWAVDDAFTVLTGSEIMIKAEDFSEAFPYHMVLDKSLCLRQWGEAIERISAVAIKVGTPLQDIGYIKEPAIYLTIDMVRLFINRAFTIAINTKIKDKRLKLQGQMMWFARSNHLFFYGSPVFKSLKNMEEHSMFLDDIPLYDATREILISSEQCNLEMEMAKKNDLFRLRLKKMNRFLEEEKRKSEDLLHEMLPKKIATQLKLGHEVCGEIFKICTIVFSDIVSFTQISSSCSAHEIINMLNDLYYRFDTHTEIFGVFKVKTIGDAYMAVTGVPERQNDHAQRMADFAMTMIEESANVISPVTGLPIEIRVGLHSGPIVSGVIGRKKPRYDIYGKSVNIASRIEAYSLPGRIHVSTSTFRLLFPYGYKFLARGQILLKGKGDIRTYFLVGDKDHMISQPLDRFHGMPVICRHVQVQEKISFRESVVLQRPAMPSPLPLLVVEHAETETKSPVSNVTKLVQPGMMGMFSRRHGTHKPSEPKSTTLTVKERSTLSSISETLAANVSNLKWSFQALKISQTVIKTSSTSGTEVEETDDVTFNPYFDKHADEELAPRQHANQTKHRNERLCACVIL